jgi:flagellar biosynthetic protein FliQ
VSAFSPVPGPDVRPPVSVLPYLMSLVAAALLGAAPAFAMNSAEAIEVTRDALVVLLKISLPPMLIGLVIGVGISLLQAVTQIQEQAVQFVPKIVVLFIALIVLLPFMLTTLATFTHEIMDRIISVS